ncbi:pseudouridine synthase [Streptococcus plurextorum]|uniref:pseudouridine synthase n=1 Tax=Streptococcus plurextorum TaxID=456876 RepID=UPI0004122CB3|nr:pseudouridine synthase [Streptococcus plurextorum]
MRLDKLLAQSGYKSRNQVKKLLKSQQIKVDGQVIRSASHNVDTGLQVITVSGKQLCHSPHTYYLMNKPAGVVSARSDEEHQTIIDLIAKEDWVEGLYPVGRLDRDTEGLVLITDNGPLGFRMLHPNNHVAKTYYVEVNGPLLEDAMSFFEQGIAFLDGPVCKPAKLQILHSSSEKSAAHLTISEGKFHQVKKMFLAYGVKVTYLKRLTFGGFTLEEQLSPGAYRSLTDDEKALIKSYF